MQSKTSVTAVPKKHVYGFPTAGKGWKMTFDECDHCHQQKSGYLQYGSTAQKLTLCYPCFTTAVQRDRVADQKHVAVVDSRRAKATA